MIIYPTFCGSRISTGRLLVIEDFTKKNLTSFEKNYDEFHSFAFELTRAADVIVLSETWFSANTCDVRCYTAFHTYSVDKTGGDVSVFIRNCYTSTYMANFCDWCGKDFVFKQLYWKYYWCLQTTRQIKNSRVHNKIE